MKWLTGAVIVLLLLWCAPAKSEGPLRCVVQRIADGDTFSCIAIPPLWGPYRIAHVRIAGIDTPESMAQLAKCAKELRLGKIAKAEIKRRVQPGTVVTMVWSGETEKYGRVLASVTLPDGKDWGDEMIRLGMAKRYTSANLTKSDWCK